jgi:hypothetical protein
MGGADHLADLRDRRCRLCCVRLRSRLAPRSGRSRRAARPSGAAAAIASGSGGERRQPCGTALPTCLKAAEPFSRSTSFVSSSSTGSNSSSSGVSRRPFTGHRTRLPMWTWCRVGNCRISPDCPRLFVRSRRVSMSRSTKRSCSRTMDDLWLPPRSGTSRPSSEASTSPSSRPGRKGTPTLPKEQGLSISGGSMCASPRLRTSCGASRRLGGRRIRSSSPPSGDSSRWRSGSGDARATTGHRHRRPAVHVGACPAHARRRCRRVGATTVLWSTQATADHPRDPQYRSKAV